MPSILLLLPTAVVLLTTLFLGEFGLLFGHLKTIGAAVVFLLSAIGWGALLLRNRLDRVDSFLRVLVFGLFSLYCFSLLLAGSRQYRPVPIIAVHIGGCILAFVFRKEVVPSFLQTFRSDGTSRTGLSIVCLLTGLQLCLGLNPTIFTDALIYHMYAPAEFLKSGSLNNLPLNFLTNSPLALQLVLGTSLPLDPTGQAYRLLIAVFGSLLPVAMAGFLRDARPAARYLAAVFVLTYPAFWVFQALGILDLMMAALLLLAAVWWRDALKTADRFDALSAGLAFGLVFSSRYQSAVSIGIVVVVLIATEFFSGNWSARKTRLVWGLLAVQLLLIAPWLLRNYLQLGNPFYPLMYTTFGGRHWSSEQAGYVRMEVLGPSFSEVSFSQKLTAPAAMLLPHPWNGLYGLGLLLPAFLLLFKERTAARDAAVLAIAGLCAWGYLHPVATPHLMRFNAHTTFFLAIAAGGWLLQQKNGWKAGAILAALSFVMSLSLLNERMPAWSALVSSNARAAMLADNVPGWGAFVAANQLMDPAKDRVLLIGESRGFYLNAPCVSPSPYNGPQLAREIFVEREPAQWTQRLQKMGITHIIVSVPEWRRVLREFHYELNPDDALLQSWLHSLPALYDDEKGTTLLRIP